MIELQKTTIDQYNKLVELGYPKLTGIDRLEPNYPTVALALQWIGDNKGIHLSLRPEFYADGINWNWQLLWYLPKEEWLSEEYDDKSLGMFYRHVETGTYLFGDNGEYPTKAKAEDEALTYALNQLIHGREYALKNIKPYNLSE